MALGLLVALSAPDRGPGPGLAALAAVEVVLTGVVCPGGGRPCSLVPAVVDDARRRGWYRWAVPTPAAVRPEPPGAG